MNCCALDELVRVEMLQQIQHFDDMIVANITNSLYVDNNLPNPLTFVPMYSYDYADEDKKLKRMRKALIKVHNWYSPTKYEASK